MSSETVYYACAIAAVVCSGLAKGGFAGLGALAMPLLSLVIDPVRAAAILLPILIVQDAVGVWAFRRTWDGHILKIMLPGMAAGVLLGYLFAAQVSESAILGVVGGISILFGLYRLWAERGANVLPSTAPDWSGTLFGIICGFTSQVAHAGAPPFQMWVLPRRLPRDIFVGTSAISFAAMNWMKVPAYAALGQFTYANMMATLALVPVAIVSTVAGVILVRKVDAQRFYTLVYLVMIALGMKLLWDAV